MAHATLVGDFRTKSKAAFLHRGFTSDRLCGARMERGAAHSRGCRTSCFLVDLLEEYCYEPSRVRGCACTMACGCGLPRGAKPPYVARGATVCSMAWGAGRSATEGLGGVTRAIRPAVFAGCMLARGAWRRAGSRVLFGGYPSRDADLCWRVLEKRHPTGT